MYRVQFDPNLGPNRMHVAAAVAQRRRGSSGRRGGRRRNVFGETPVVGRYVADSPDRDRTRERGGRFLMERNGMRASSVVSDLPVFWDTITGEPDERNRVT